MRHPCIYKNGKAKVYDLDFYIADLKSKNGKRGYIILEEEKNETTNDQHAYYRGIILKQLPQTEEFGGWTKNELHSLFTTMFLGEEKMKTVRLPGGGLKEIRLVDVPSTADIGKKRMRWFIDEIIRYLATEHNIKFKSPEEYYGKKGNNN